MNTPNFFAAPDYTPVVRMMAMQTRFAIETSQGLMKLAMMPWTGLPMGFGSICTPMGSMTVTTRVVEPAPEPQAAPVDTVDAKPVDVVEEKVAETAAAPEVFEVPKAAPAVEAKPVVEAPKPVAPKVTAPKVETPKPVEPKVEKPAPTAPVVKAEAPKTPEPKAEAKPAPVEAPVEGAVAMEKPKAISAPKGMADDLTVLNGVGPKLAEALNAEGIYSYAQIASWTEANVAWIDENLPGVRGRASRNGWVAQATKLAG